MLLQEPKILLSTYPTMLPQPTKVLHLSRSNLPILTLCIKVVMHANSIFQLHSYVSYRCMGTSFCSNSERNGQSNSKYYFKLTVENLCHNLRLSMRFGGPSTECDLIIICHVLFTSFFRSIPKVARMQENFQGITVDHHFLKRPDLLNFMLRLSKTKHRRQLAVSGQRPYGPSLSTAS